MGRLAVAVSLSTFLGLVGCTTTDNGGDDPDVFDGGALTVDGGAKNGAFGGNGGTVTYNFDCSQAIDYTVEAVPSTGNFTVSVYSDSNYSNLIAASPGATGGPETVTVTGPRDVCYVEVSGDFGASFSISVTSDGSGGDLSVTGTTPMDAAVNVDPMGVIQVNFNTSLDSSTVNGINITITPAVAGSWSMNGQANAMFQPSNDLPWETLFTVTVSTAVTNTNGVGMAMPYTFSFTSADAPVQYYTVGGTVSGLALGTEDVTISLSDGTAIYTKYANANGSFTVDTATLPGGTAYTVTVSDHPFFKNCSVTNGTGTISGANVTDVAVDCSTEQTYNLGGTVFGLYGTGLTLSDGTSTKTIAADGAFTFSTAFGYPDTYTVTVTTQPTSPVQDCEIFSGTGTFDSEGDQLDVYISCRVMLSAYPASGNDWNSYVVNDGTDVWDSSGDACVAGSAKGYADCVHGGEIRQVTSGATSCGSYVAHDALNAFEWACDDSSGKAVFYSLGLRERGTMDAEDPGAYLSDLINWETGEWKLNNLIVIPPNSELDLGVGTNKNTTPLEDWWDNPIETWSSGMALDQSGTVYVVTDNPMEKLALTADKVSLVIKPGVVMTGSATVDEKLVHISGSNFFWFEGELDATGDSYGIHVQSSEIGTLRGVVVSNTTGTSGRGILVASSQGIWLRDLRVFDSASTNLSLTQGQYNDVDGALLEGAAVDGLSIDESDAWISRVTVGFNSYNGIRVKSAGTNAWFEDIVVDNNADPAIAAYGINIQANNVTIHGASVINNMSEGVRTTGANTVIVDLVTSNNVGSGLVIRGNNGIFRGILAWGNGRLAAAKHGIECHSLAQKVYISHVTATNNGSHGVSVQCTGVLENIVVSNNDRGLYLGGNANVSIYDVVASNNQTYGISQSNSTAYFSGVVELGNNGASPADDCHNAFATGLLFVAETTNACTNQGSSDADIYGGADAEFSFTGKVIVAGDETTNLSHTGSAVLYSDIMDWTSFDTLYRGWGFDGAASQFAPGGCESGTPDDDCIIWDWRIDQNDTLLLDIFTEQLAGNASNTATEDVGGGSQKFLLNAIEILGDGQGDDDGLCETDEACLFTPNTGAYQGQGSVGSAGTFVDGTDTLPLTGIDLQRYFFSSN